MGTYSTRVARAVERRVLSRLPIVGSGDPLDRAALESGLAELQLDLAALADGLRGPATTAGRRVLEHGRKEAQRMLNTALPPDAATRIFVHDYAENAVLRMKYAGQAQVDQIRKAIEDYVEGDSMRADIEHSLWVSRNRSAFVARDNSYKFHRLAVAEWCARGGSEYGFYVTRRDERVRPGHHANDGKKFRWDSPPATLQEPNCRCRMVPVEVDLL